MKGSGFIRNVEFYLSHVSDETCQIGSYLLVAAYIVVYVLAARQIVTISSRVYSGLRVLCAMHAFYVIFFLWRNNIQLDEAVFRGVVRRFFLQVSSQLRM